jgi:tRNA-specific 2-thiouridylase
VADKKDSYEICFVPDQDHAGFLRNFRGPQETAGEFVDLLGNVLGRHEGYERFTIGQRKGLGLAFGEPRFVIRIDPQTKQVVLGRHEDLAVSVIQVHQTNWLVAPPQSAFSCEVKVRYRQRSESCTVVPAADGTARIETQTPVFGVAPGQAAVFYDGRRVLGGGWIC